MVSWRSPKPLFQVRILTGLQIGFDRVLLKLQRKWIPSRPAFFDQKKPGKLIFSRFWEEDGLVFLVPGFFIQLAHYGQDRSRMALVAGLDAI